MKPKPITTLTVRSPEDMLALVPVVLGFLPQESMVMLTFGGRSPFHGRLDLPPTEHVDEAVAMLHDPAVRHRIQRTAFLVYSDDHRLARAISKAVVGRFERSGIQVIDVLRVHEGRWFPVLSGRHRGVPRIGVPYDLSAHPFTAEAVFRGLPMLASRDELDRLLSLDPDRGAEVAAAVALVRPADREQVRAAVERHVRTGAMPTAVLAAVLLGIRDPMVRDAAWDVVRRRDAPEHVHLWTDAVQRAPQDLAGGAAAVLALASWVAGQGALAWCAVDRAHRVDPDNSLAALVLDLLVGAVPPSTWERFSEEWHGPGSAA